jgi:hypothetical protein
MNRPLSDSTRLASSLSALAIAAIAIMGGCAGNHPADQWRKDRTAAPGVVGVSESGFLGDYSKLVPSPRHPDTRYEQTAAFATYGAFHIEPFIVLPDTTARGVELSEADKTEIAADMADELRSALSKRYRVVDGPGEGVASVRGAITAVARGGRSPDGEPWLGGASIEVEIVDSLTNKRVAAAVESDSVDPLDEGRSGEEGSDFYDARMVFRHWSHRYVRWVDAAHSGEMPATR